MGIYEQPGKWECGPFALKHALLMRGVLATEREIAKAAGTTPEGTDEAQLARAAGRFGFELPTVRQLEADPARSELIKFLRRGISCLLCVNEWDHWVTAVHEERGKFIVLDSAQEQVILVVDWPRLSELWAYHERDANAEDAARTVFDLHPLIPQNRAPRRARFSLERAQYLLRSENRALARLWDFYVEDLIAMCRPPEKRDRGGKGGAGSGGGGRSLALGELLRRHTALFLDELEAWHGKVQRPAAERVLERMRFVAETYGLVIRQSERTRTVSAVSMILALWAAGEFGVEPLYRRVPVRKLR